MKTGDVLLWNVFAYTYVIEFHTCLLVSIDCWTLTSLLSIYSSILSFVLFVEISINGTDTGS